MATIIRVNIANGYRPQVDAYVEAHPGLAADQAVQRWVEERYGSWISSNLTEGFAIHDVTPAQFLVAFVEPGHAYQFQSLIGGQEVADGA